MATDPHTKPDTPQVLPEADDSVWGDESAAKLAKRFPHHPWITRPAWVPDPNRVRTRTIKDSRGVRLLTAQELVFVDAYLDGACGSAVEAARYAGYADPAARGQETKRRLAPVLEAEAKRRREAALMGPRELLEWWTSVIRSSPDGSTSAMKASELLGRAHGVLTDKLDTRIDREAIVREIAGVLSSPKLLAERIARDQTQDAEIITERAE